MSKLSYIADAALRRCLGNVCQTKVTLAINAASAATIKTTGAMVYSVDGIFTTQSALAAQSIAVTHSLNGLAVADGPAAYVQPANTSVYYIVARNFAGTVAFVQGGYNGQNITLPGGIVMTSKGEMPEVPVGYTPIGIMKVALGATTFTPATTLLDAANVTVTYYDVALIPSVNP